MNKLKLKYDIRNIESSGPFPADRISRTQGAGRSFPRKLSALAVTWYGTTAPKREKESGIIKQGGMFGATRQQVQTRRHHQHLDRPGDVGAGMDDILGTSAGVSRRGATLGAEATDVLFPVLPNARPAFLADPNDRFGHHTSAAFSSNLNFRVNVADARGSTGRGTKLGGAMGHGGSKLGGDVFQGREQTMLSGDSFMNGENEHDTPLFERRSLEERRESQLANGDYRQGMRTLHMQLQDSSEQLAMVEGINDDLEHRLERLALRHVEDVRKKDEELTVMRKERDAALANAEHWKKEHDIQVKRRDRALENLRRVEQELYRMHLRKYDIVSGKESAEEGGGVRNGSSAHVLKHSQLPPGFPVPREVSLNIQSPHSKMMTFQEQGQDIRWSNKPCHVHGRVGCPCSALAIETNQAAGLSSLSDFLGIEGEDFDSPDKIDFGSSSESVGRTIASLPQDIQKEPSLVATPQKATSPGGVSLHDFAARGRNL